MARISVLIPTHEHATTLPYALRSVQTQGVDDLEILICGDGVTDQVRAVVNELQQTEPRIRFFDLPKAPNIGELNRDIVMSEATGEIVCVHNDDDLWLPGHIQALTTALEHADFAGAMQVNVGIDGKVRAYYFDLERPEFVDLWLDWKSNDFGSWACNGFGPIFAAFRLDAYRRLPERWATTPAGATADQTMWRKFVRQPWCRSKFLRWPIALHFASSDRHDWTPEQRADELRRWTEIIESPDYADRIWRDILPELGDRLLQQSLKDRDQRREMMAADGAVRERMAAETSVFIDRIRQLEAEVAALGAAAVTQAADAQVVLDARDAAISRMRELEASVSAVRELAATQAANAQVAFDAARDTATARIRELETEVAAVREGAATHAADSQRVFDETRDAATARIRELEAEIAAVKAVATTQAMDSQSMFDAARDAATARIRELEAEVAAVKAVATTQAVDSQSMFDAARDAATARIRELEAEVAAVKAVATTQAMDSQSMFDAAREAATARIRELETEVAAVRAAAATQMADIQSVFDAMRDAAAERIRQLENQIETTTAAAAAQIEAMRSSSLRGIFGRTVDRLTRRHMSGNRSP